MIEPWAHEIARQRHQHLIASAERYRLGRIVRERSTHRRTSSSWLTFLVGRAFRMSRFRTAARRDVRHAEPVLRALPARRRGPEHEVHRSRSTE